MAEKRMMTTKNDAFNYIIYAKYMIRMGFIYTDYLRKVTFETKMNVQ